MPLGNIASQWEEAKGEHGITLKAVLHLARTRGIPSKWAWEILLEMASEPEIRCLRDEANKLLNV